MRISDWSSDVCSSDLMSGSAPIWAPMKRSKRVVPIPVMTASTSTLMPEETIWPRTRSAMKAVRPKKAKGIRTKPASVTSLNSRSVKKTRSEERRVGKEWVSTCRSREQTEHKKKQYRRATTHKTEQAKKQP